jgi:chaperonin GroEL (HSP60 family)
VVAGSLIEKAEDLITKDVHPTIIVDGYKKCSIKANEILKNAAANVDPDNKDMLNKISKTSMASKMVSSNSEELSKIVVDAILSVAERSGEDIKVDIDDIKVEKKPGGSINDTSLIKGIVLDKEVVHSGMPKKD